MDDRVLTDGEVAAILGSTDIPIFVALARSHEALREAALYLAGYDVAGWEAHMTDAEVLAKVGLAPHA